MPYYVYILTNKPKGSLYIGVTNNIIRRVYEHREGILDGFTKQYKLHHLVYFETYGEVYKAIHREKILKHWLRDWKIALIEKENPAWEDLWYKINS